MLHQYININGLIGCASMIGSIYLLYWTYHKYQENRERRKFAESLYKTISNIELVLHEMGISKSAENAVRNNIPVRIGYALRVASIENIDESPKILINVDGNVSYEGEVEPEIILDFLKYLEKEGYTVFPKNIYVIDRWCRAKYHIINEKSSQKDDDEEIMTFKYD